MRQISRTAASIFVAVALYALPLPSAAEQTSVTPTNATRAAASDNRADAYKKELTTALDGMTKMGQEMVDSVFSFSELAHQEFETSRYLTNILEKHGFTVRRGVAGMPTAWIATWGSGKPVIALGSDIDGIPQASQKPGVRTVSR
jgi:aminobenzoyl-glutamate utilization protein B